MISPLWIHRIAHDGDDFLIMWHEPYSGCDPYLAFWDGWFCPIKWEHI